VKRGLGSPRIDPARKLAIHKMGGRAVQQAGTGHRWTSETGARAADIATMNRLRKKGKR
jgi:hypothetical protein